MVFKRTVSHVLCVSRLEQGPKEKINEWHCSAHNQISNSDL